MLPRADPLSPKNWGIYWGIRSWHEAPHAHAQPAQPSQGRPPQDPRHLRGRRWTAPRRCQDTDAVWWSPSLVRVPSVQPSLSPDLWGSHFRCRQCYGARYSSQYEVCPFASYADDGVSGASWNDLLANHGVAPANRPRAGAGCGPTLPRSLSPFSGSPISPRGSGSPTSICGPAQQIRPLRPL